MKLDLERPTVLTLLAKIDPLQNLTSFDLDK